METSRFVVLLFARGGYHGCCFNTSLEALHAEVAKRSASKNIIACSTPFIGITLEKSGLLDVSLPSEWREVIGHLDSSPEE